MHEFQQRWALLSSGCAGRDPRETTAISVMVLLLKNTEFLIKTPSGKIPVSNNQNLYSEIKMY
jgi:hypothetical protein